MSRNAALKIDVPTVQEVQTGLPSGTFRKLSHVLGLAEVTLGRHLSIPPATLYRRLSTGRFTSEESDRLARLTRLYARALDVLGDRESVRDWFMAPNPSFGGKRPFDLTQTDPGSVEVERLLGRIEYGVF
jgi:putative toxin-antitoxin system antitoxin component (TIGR02293 family)